MACQSSSTSGGLPSDRHPHSWCQCAQHTFFFFPSQCQLISSLSNHCFRKVCRELRLHHWPRLPNFPRLIVVYHGEPSGKAVNHHLDWAVIIFLMICRELQRIELLAAQRVPETLLLLGGPCCLLAANHLPHTTCFCPCPEETSCSLQAGSGGNEGTYTTMRPLSVLRLAQ